MILFSKRTISMTWKGYTTPIGSTPGTIRPIGKDDASDCYRSQARPIKCARRGRNISGRMNARENTSVKFAIDAPCGYSVTQEPCPLSIPVQCPQPVQQRCNAESNARNRVKGASTLLKPNYFTTMQRYRENRCSTYQQRAFNFVESGNALGKPGDPSTINTTYTANCNRPLDPIDVIQTNCHPAFTMEQKQSCPTVSYKPNNYQFAQQGAVSSSTRMLKLTTDTVETSNYNFVNGKKVAHTTKFIECATRCDKR
jgi:hypothetical protein